MGGARSLRGVLVGTVLSVLVVAGCTADDAGSPTPSPGRATPTAEPVPTVTPPVSPLPTLPTEGSMQEFVEAFLAARVDGDRERARTFLGADADRQYAEGDLQLTDGFSDAEIVSTEAVDANSFEVRIRITREDDTTFEELLFVGPGPDRTGEQRRWIVRGATNA